MCIQCSQVHITAKVLTSIFSIIPTSTVISGIETSFFCSCEVSNGTRSFCCCCYFVTLKWCYVYTKNIISHVIYGDFLPIINLNGIPLFISCNKKIPKNQIIFEPIHHRDYWTFFFHVKCMHVDSNILAFLHG